MPVYNAEPHLAEALESVLGQSFAGFEIVIVNDGSSDGSAEIIRRFAERDRRIKARFCPRRGVAAARNECVGLARAELLAVMDADDVAEPNRLEIQLAYLNDHPECVALGGQMLFVDEDGDRLWPSDLPLDHDAIDARHMACCGGALANPTAMLRREAVIRAGGYRSEFQIGAEDFDLLLRLAEVGRLANLPNILVRYRLHDQSLTARFTGEQRELALPAIREACVRRGIDFRPPDIPLPAGASRAVELAHRAMKAREHGYLRTARKYAIRTLGAAPLSLLAWRVATVVFIGSRLRNLRAHRPEDGVRPSG
jgi:glycosyltransferase involved in cell wall biosynthesis